MLTVQTLVPLMAEPLPIPALVISGRCPPNNVIMTLDAAAALPDFDLCSSIILIMCLSLLLILISLYFSSGPEFHNGAAAGLRIGFSDPTPLAALMSFRDSRSHGQATNRGKLNVFNVIPWLPIAIFK